MKIGKTLHPTPHTPHPTPTEKLFAANPIYSLPTMTIDSLLQPFQRFGVNLGLERIKNLLEILGKPQDKIPIIHVTGTNGKGSVCAYLSSILSTAG
ncbi:MAG: bifunctional folylpolyglutamate synthase/dihydrofolate synthase, partial [Microcystis sp. M53601_WE4]|nr:bifunctional folylpolyglutamate synthase/dihydrofolate synthase [Microcystis sp. M53601_WE4]